MSLGFNSNLDGPGRLARVMIWEDGDAHEVRLKWGLKPIEPGGRVVSLLQSERWPVTNPCLMIANAFGLKVDGKTKYRASLITDEPFFCVAGMWRRETSDWPASFAALTVEAYPDLAPYKDRHVAVVRPEDWYDWLMQARRKQELLRPFPLGSFRVEGIAREKVMADLFA